MNPLIRPWRHLFDFRGRASRREYALFHLGIVALYVLTTIITATGMVLVFALLARTNDGGPLFAITWLGENVLFLLLFVIGHVSVSIRRLHDANEPWIRYLFTLLPIVGLVFWARLVFRRGTDGENDYGHDPRYPAPVSTEMLGAVFS
jgi:uncharacterized membrane protein YhaH (DUF805 family)